MGIEIEENMGIPETEPKESETTKYSASNMLETINQAIYAIAVGGQHYKIGSRSLTRADLKQLYQMRKELQGEVAAEKNTGLFDDCYVAVFDRR